MNKVWIFFKLRMLQLRYDKTALFFSYFLPVILLTGIGFPMEMANKKTLEVHYSDMIRNDQSVALITYLKQHSFLNLLEQPSEQYPYKQLLKTNNIAHFLLISAVNSAHLKDVLKDKSIGLTLYSSDATKVKIQSLAIAKIIDQYFDGERSPNIVEHYVSSGTLTSYITTLLPGLIGMTLLTIGLNGFGGVLIVEYDSGLFRNIKTIDASPFPFLGGLFLSRLFICYTVAIALYLLGVLMFNLSTHVDFLLLLIVVTLGCTSFLGIGLVIAVLSKSVSAFNGIVNFVNIPFVVFSGVFFSIAAFPEWLQIGAQIIPLTHMNTAVKSILFEQVGITDVREITKELIVLSGWCLGTVVLGLKKFKW